MVKKKRQIGPDVIDTEAWVVLNGILVWVGVSKKNNHASVDLVDLCDVRGKVVEDIWAIYQQLRAEAWGLA